MKRNYYLSQREALQYALKQLHHANTWTTFRMDEDCLDEEIMLRYFESDFESGEEETIEKLIEKSVVRTVYEANYIPKKRKQKWAIHAGQETVDVIRYAKIAYQEQSETKRLGRKEAEWRRKQNRLTKRLGVIDGVGNFLVRMGEKISLTKAVELLTGNEIPDFIKHIFPHILPKKIKGRLRDGAGVFVDETVNVARDAIAGLTSLGVDVATKVGGELSDTTDKVVESRKKVVSVVTKKFVDLRNEVREEGGLWNWGKKKIKRLFNR